ncbi:I78 family peptidase inhibitor [Paracoccus marcusii]|uniref:I78 family peptidase inhibitor n=1 Tax=Paracoccus marcusii TaxID=59779 RepID=UPI002ED3DF12|nr:I78 family peptidase inhibitor [Paracoccus marcusii]
MITTPSPPCPFRVAADADPERLRRQPYDIPARQCDLSQHQALVGRNIGEVRLPPNLRKREVHNQGVMTRDYNPARLTMFLDAKGWIARVDCS